MYLMISHFDVLTFFLMGENKWFQVIVTKYAHKKTNAFKLITSLGIWPSLSLRFLLQQEFNLSSHHCFSFPLFYRGYCCCLEAHRLPPFAPFVPPPALRLSHVWFLYLFLSNSLLPLFLSAFVPLLSPTLPLLLPSFSFPRSLSPPSPPAFCLSICFFVALLYVPQIQMAVKC